MPTIIAVTVLGSGQRRSLVAGIIVLMAVAVVLTGSRAGVLAAAVALVVMFPRGWPRRVVCALACVVVVAAIGLGKIVFGGLGQNIFNPAMVGRAFVMIAFPALLAAGGYVVGSEQAWVDTVTAATIEMAYSAVRASRQTNVACYI